MSAIDHAPEPWRRLEGFLLARIAEDEELARIPWWPSWEADGPADETRIYGEGRTLAIGWARDLRHMARHDPARVLAECEAKRAMVAHAGDADDWTLMTLLALPYADHPDYDEAWRV